jgi:hypothetical protein
MINDHLMEDFDHIIQKVRNQTECLIRRAGASKRATHRQSKYNNKTLSENIDSFPASFSQSSELRPKAGQTVAIGSQVLMRKQDKPDSIKTSYRPHESSSEQALREENRMLRELLADYRQALGSARDKLLA